MLDFHEVVASHEWTCLGCPSQVEGTLKDGQRFYFRFRWGVANLGVGATHDEAIRDPASVSAEWGDEWAGVLSQKEFEALFMQLLPQRHTIRRV